MAGIDEFAPDVDLNEAPEIPESPAEPETPVDTKVEQPAEQKPAEPKPEEHKQQKLVPLEALHESRIKEREARQRAEQIERDFQERYKKLEERLEKLANPPPAVPRFEEDPASHLLHQVEATKAELAQVRQTSEQARQSQELSAFEARIAQDTQAAEMAFAKEKPDYLSAVSYLQQVADKNMQMMGVEDPAVRQAQIRKDALAMSLKALQLGKSPAEVAYNLAINYGYRASVPRETSDAAKKIESIQEGQKTQSMPSGGKPSPTLTLAALEQMDDEDFNKLVDDDASWKKLIRQMQ